MPNANATTPAPRRRRSWLRILGWVVGLFVVLLVVLYFVATSSAFLKGVILPRVSKAMGADVTVSDASISPFSQVILHSLKVQAPGQEALVVAPEVRLRYSLMDIIKGNIHVDEVTVTSPTVALVTHPDGSSNLDPILKAQQEQAKAQPKAEKPAQPTQPAKPSKPMQIDIRKVALTDATIRTVKEYAGGKSDVAEISHFNVNLSDLKNGATGKLTVGADINMQNNPPAPASSGLLQAKLSGDFTLALTPDLKPGSVQGSSKLEVTRAEGALAQAAQFAGNLNCDITPTLIKEVALRFLKGGTPLGQVRLSGPFDMEKQEGQLSLEVLNIDKNLLNLAGASSGLDFGPTTISSTNLIQLSKGGSLINAAGRFNLDQLQVTRTNQTTPPLDLHANYDVAVDRAASNAVLRVLTLNGTEKGNTFLTGELTSPMTIAFGGNASAVSDSALSVTITNFDLADWKVFLADVAPAGLVNGQFKLLSQQAGKLLTFDLNSRIDNLTAGSGSNQITQATVTFQMNGKATDLKQFNLPQYKLEVARQNQSLVTVSGSATYDQASQNADVQLTAQLLLAKLLQALPRPDLNISSGSAEAKLHIVQTATQNPNAKPQTTNLTQTITGNFVLTNLTGQVGSNVFRNFGTVADLDVGVTPQQAEIRKLTGRLLQGQTVGGTFAVNGTYDMTNKATHLTAKLADFNQAGLGTFLQPMLGDKQLVSVALNGNAVVQYDPAAASTVTGDLQITNLVVKDPSGQVPATPLEARAQLDVGLNKQVLTLRQVLLALTPTARATNQVQLTGQVDMSQTNAIQGNLKLAADALDFTTYYDLFAGQKSAAAKPTPATTKPAQPAASTTAAAAPKPEQEPPAMQLPLRNFTFETSIRHIYLHDIDIADVQNTTKLDGGHVVVNPCALKVNGAPVTALVDADLGVAGYKYNVSFNAQAIPLAPLVDSFQPDRKGILSGTLTAQSKIDGAGITGPSLRKNLAGQFDFNSTNLNLSIDNIQGNTWSTRLLKTVLNAIASIPELVKNPAGAGASLVQGLVSRSGPSTTTATTGGLAGDLKKSPINSIILRGNAGTGTVTLQQALVQSPAFEAAVSGGTVTLADVLTNSPINLPVSISLERSVAQKINLAGNTPTNATYAQLPQFLTMTGTLGNSKPKVDILALGAAAAQGAGGTAGQVGSAVQGFKSLFGGGSKTNAPSSGTTNPPGATNQSPVNNLLNRFLKK
jgi:uncharacterized protein involved in outer membrane biogenesis